MQEAGRGLLVVATSVVEGFYSSSYDDLKSGKPIALVLITGGWAGSKQRKELSLGLAGGTFHTHKESDYFKVIGFPEKVQVLDSSGRMAGESAWELQEGKEWEKGVWITLDALGGGPQATAWKACFEYSNTKIKFPFCLEVGYLWTDQGNVR